METSPVSTQLDDKLYSLTPSDTHSGHTWGGWHRQVPGGGKTAWNRSLPPSDTRFSIECLTPPSSEGGFVSSLNGDKPRLHFYACFVLGLRENVPPDKGGTGC